jgi:hypothetical protein
MSPIQITGRTSGNPASLADYEALFRAEERPHKFSAQEVGFIMPIHLGQSRFRCGSCRHWFMNPATGKAVCEIMRLPDEKNVPADATCRFWNVKGQFPLLRSL